MLVALAYLPTGVQSARHVLGASKNGNAAAHVMHWDERAPKQVAHSGAHGTQTSFVVAEPPEHVKPSSTSWQSLRHPSESKVLLSSQTSDPMRWPSPHMGVHVVMVLIEPPMHSKPASTVHVALHPSPDKVLSAHAWIVRARMRV